MQRAPPTWRLSLPQYLGGGGRKRGRANEEGGGLVERAGRRGSWYRERDRVPKKAKAGLEVAIAV